MSDVTTKIAALLRAASETHHRVFRWTAPEGSGRRVRVRCAAVRVPGSEW